MYLTFSLQADHLAEVGLGQKVVEEGDDEGQAAEDSQNDVKQAARVFLVIFLDVHRQAFDNAFVRPFAVGFVDGILAVDDSENNQNNQNFNRADHSVLPVSTGMGRIRLLKRPVTGLAGFACSVSPPQKNTFKNFNAATLRLPAWPGVPAP